MFRNVAAIWLDDRRKDTKPKTLQKMETILKGDLMRLMGVPVVLKDNICTSDMPTTCASKILAGWSPPYDAAVVEMLKAEGAI